MAGPSRTWQDPAGPWQDLAGPGRTWQDLAVLGIAVAVLVNRSLGALLFGVDPADPYVLLTVTSALLLAAWSAALLAAWRGTRVDPLLALRTE